jgi:beta-glucanase (GH16 family)
MSKLTRTVPTGLIATCILCVVCPLLAQAQIPDVPGWRLSWHDEFDGTSLNNANWEALDRQDSYNNEKQYYRPEQVTVADGNLQITATNQPLANKNYRSGLITSKALYGPGRFEARIDLPTTQGMWPAFWLNPNQVQWPTGGEIDILENRGSQPNLTSSAFHWQKDPGPCCGQHQYVFHEYTATEDGAPVDFHAGFHTYAVEWRDTQIRFYVDGNLHFTVNENSNMSDANFQTAKNIILNLAIGGDFGGDPNGSTVWPQTMLVDYVRVWKLDTAAPGDYNGDGTVDAADYTVWRDSLGHEGIGLSADGSGNGSVGPEDYEIWKNSLGEGSGGGSAAVSAPEPSAIILITVGILLFCPRHSWMPVSHHERDKLRQRTTQPDPQ